MRIRSTLVLLLIGSATEIMAQTGGQVPFEPGLRALQFGVSGGLLPDRANGGLISYRKFISPDKARYAGLSLQGGISRASTHERFNTREPDGGAQDTVDQHNLTGGGSLNIGLSAGRTRFIPSKTTLRPFVSGGFTAYGLYTPRINRNASHASVNNSTSDVEGRISSRQLVLGAGLEARAGVEWFPARNISLLFEYGGRIGLDWGITTDRQQEAREYNDSNVVNEALNRRTRYSTAFGFGQLPVRTCLSFYF